jgi:uncharacterized membrane protein SpoIIM required for sporulation
MPAGRSAIDLRPRHEVETPEHVTLRYEVAGLGSRALAAGTDHLIIALLFAGLGALSDALAGLGLEWFFVLLYFAVYWGYFAAFEAWWRGQTPGKRLLRLRVVRLDGRAAGFEGAALRNLLRYADLMLPPVYITGILLILLHPRAQRLGDLVAGTLVVRDAPLEAPLPPPPPAAAAAGRTALVARLTPQKFEVLESYLARGAALDAEARRRLAAGLAHRFADRLPERPADPEAFLAQLHREERERRLAGRGGNAGEIAALRLAARQGERWEAFDRQAARAAARGLDSFGAAELPEFAARYREVAADLARLRTYRAPAALLDRIERLVAAGHNALYPRGEPAWRRIGPLLFRDCPAAVIRARGTVLLAVALLVASAGAGYAVLRERPALGETLIPEVMQERAASASRRTSEGRTYAEVADAEAPRLAAALMTHNIGVAFACFAGGILLGVGALVLLVSNGLSLGAIFGHFVNAGVGGYLGAFVLGHGVLELTAICFATAAGFRLGRALWAPGDLTRGDALRVEGTLALRLLGAAAVLLVIAGSIEGLASASGAGLPYRAAIAAASAAFLTLYLVNGARWARTLGGP